MSGLCRGEPPTSLVSTSRSAMANPASGVSRSSIISTTLGVCTAMPSSRPAVSDVTTVESAPDCSSRCWFSASRTAAMILALGASSRAVSVTRTAASSRLVATMIALACWALASRSTSESVALPRTVTSPALLARSRAAGSSSTTTMSAGAIVVADHRGDRRPALGAVPDDDGVVAHFAPPSLDLQCLARLRGERLDGGTDQDDQERHPQRRDHQNVDQPRRRGDRGDVAVARWSTATPWRSRGSPGTTTGCRVRAADVAVAVRSR